MRSTLDVNGHPVELFEPAGARSGLLFLHDGDGTFPTVCQELLTRHSLACACPQGGELWWSSRPSPGFEKPSAERWLLDSLVPALLARWQLAPNALALAGVGMGGQGALRVAFKHPQTFRIAAAVNAALDHHELYGEGTPLDEMYSSREHCRQDTAILHIHPAKQPAHIWFGVDPANRWFRGNDRLHEKLGALGVPHTFEVSAGIGGKWELMLRFVAEALAQEGRRLV